jgi:hypothetical protein
MTKPNTISINVLLDCSSSMSERKLLTIANFNSFLQEQKLVPGEAYFTMAHFSDDYTLKYNNVPIADAPELNENNYITYGWTALLDGIGKLTDDVGARLASMPENERPSKVLVVVVTDGQENASKLYTTFNNGKARIREKIKHQSNKYDWTYVFMGCNQDAVLTGTELGIDKGNCLRYSMATPGEYIGAKNMLSKGTEKLRLCSSSKTSAFFSG